jgi:hypothetical protein
MKYFHYLFLFAFAAASSLAQDPTAASTFTPAPESTSGPLTTPESTPENLPASIAAFSSPAATSPAASASDSRKKHRSEEADGFDHGVKFDVRHGPHTVVTELAEVLVPIAFFGTVVLVVGGLFYLRYRQKVSLHNTIRALVEKGIDIPPALLTPAPPPVRRRSDLRRGVFWVAFGTGLVAFFLGEARDAWGLGLIPLFIGVAYLIVWKIESKNDQP